MKTPELERMHPASRRRFMKLLGAALAAPTIPAAIRYAVGDMVGSAEAQEPPMNFIEINLRDQWDHGHLFVAPGLATYANLKRGESGRMAAMFYQMADLAQRPNNVYLTPESMALDPHLDTIACIETCELSVGAIHGHEAANALRSPGRSYDQTGGKMPMFQNDPVSNFPQGVEEFYTTTPTPATLHNFWSKSKGNSPRNGIAFKGISRSIHTAYHFAAGLAGAELDRIQSKDALFEAFPEQVQDLNILPTAAEAETFRQILAKVDPKFLEKRHYGKGAIDSHTASLLEAEKLLFSNSTKVVSLPLTPEEEMYWGEGVPDQATSPSDVKAQIWEQVAYAYKIVESGMSRSVSLEFDYVDVHDQRTADQMNTMTLQVALSLSRLIAKLKEAGIYERTLIAIYTTDGGRSPAAGSAGNEGKNSIVLAGGMIKGGYWGDVGVAGDDGDGHVYSFRAPDPETGALLAPSTNNDGRLPGAYVWRTVAKALGISDDVAGQFPDVAGAHALDFVLKG